MISRIVLPKEFRRILAQKICSIKHKGRVDNWERYQLSPIQAYTITQVLYFRSKLKLGLFFTSFTFSFNDGDSVDVAGHDITEYFHDTDQDSWRYLADIINRNCKIPLVAAAEILANSITSPTITPEEHSFSKAELNGIKHRLNMNIKL